MMMVMMSTSLR